MRRLAPVVALALLTACAPKDEAPAAAAAPPAPTLADFAGTWQVSSVLPNSPTPIASTMTGTADPASWTMSLEGRPNIALTVSVAGDSLIGQTAEYESILRKGVMVTVRTASVKTASGLSGNLVATYKTASGTEVVNGTMTATKAP